MVFVIFLSSCPDMYAYSFLLIFEHHKNIFLINLIEMINLNDNSKDLANFVNGM